jgi:hypothetical protein
MPIELDLAAPCEHRVQSQLGAVVADDHAWLTASGEQIGQSGHLPLPQIEVFGTAAEHSRVTSSTMLSTPNQRPVAIWLCTKPRLQR